MAACKKIKPYKSTCYVKNHDNKLDLHHIYVRALFNLFFLYLN